jgi:apolipoprotein N-acyltransferase
LKILKRSLLYALCSGLLLVVTFPGVFGWWPFAWVALVPLFLAAERVPPKQAFRLGMAAGMIHYVFLLYWILIVLSRYGHLGWWVTVPALLLLSLYMSVYTALFALIISWAVGRGKSLLWLAPALWVGLDFIRSWLFSGFPWQDMAYSQYNIPILLQIADLFGHYGITFLIVLTNSLVYTIIKRIQQAKGTTSSAEPMLPGIYSVSPVSIAAAGILIVAAMGYNLVRYEQVSRLIAASPTQPVSVIQGNIPQDLKWTPDIQQETIEIYNKISEQVLSATGTSESVPLLVWPETALPLYLGNDVLIPESVSRLTSENQVYLLTGVPYADTSVSGSMITTDYYNSVILLTPEGVIGGRYNKQHLVPFGEYIPFRKILPLPGPLVESMGDFAADSPQKPLTCQTARIGVLICFESIFPNLTRHWVNTGANLLVNVTNDAWFGRSSAPWQHFSMAVLRAVETRRSLARAANTGVSGFVDPLGHTSGLTPLFRAGYASWDVPLCEVATFFVRYGYIFPIVCITAALMLILLPAKIRLQQNDLL